MNYRVNGFLRSRLSGCHATVPPTPTHSVFGGVLCDIPKEDCEGDYRVDDSVRKTRILIFGIRRGTIVVNQDALKDLTQAIGSKDFLYLRQFFYASVVLLMINFVVTL